MNKREYYVSKNGVTTFDFINEYLKIGAKNKYNNRPFTAHDGAMLFNILKYLCRTKKQVDDRNDWDKIVDYTKAYHKLQNTVDYQHVGDYFHTNIIPFILSNNELQARSNFNKWRDEFEKKYLM